MSILILGDCIASGENVLLSKVTGIDNYVAEGLNHKLLVKLQDKVMGWSGQTNFKDAKTFLRHQEKLHSWPAQIPNSTNLSVSGETFQGMHKKLREYLKNNSKPDLVLITDFSQTHRSVVVNYQNNQYVVKRDINLLNEDQSIWEDCIYDMFQVKCRQQEDYGQQFQNKKTKKSFRQLQSLLKYHDIDYKFLVFRHANRSIDSNYIWCNTFLDLYKVGGGREDCDAKLNAQTDIAEFILTHIKKYVE
jgi:Holliday junction resolvasome RuvABC DNA-binding subunit